MKILLLILALSVGTTIHCNADDCLALSESHDVFRLRDVGKAPDSSDFCKGVADLDSLQLSTGRKHLQAFLSLKPADPGQYSIHELLAYAYLRTGRYKATYSELQAALKLKPSADDVKQGVALASALAEYPDQTLAHFEPSIVHAMGGQIPITINGQPASYFVDTGAMLSIISESEAHRLGMKVQDASPTIKDADGLRIGVRIANAEDVVIGKMHLKHVAFAVLQDTQEPFVHEPPNHRGGIGISVLLAMRSLSFDRSGHFEFGTRWASHPTQEVNMLFDGASPVVQIASRGNLREFTLDTGADGTDLGPAFGRTFPELLTQGHKEKEASTGIGGTVTLGSTKLASVSFNVGGKDVTLQPAFVLDDVPENSRLWAAGNLGHDLLDQSERVSIDFVSMTLSLQ